MTPLADEGRSCPPTGCQGAPCFRFWGVRGSVATPGPGTVKYGGNTSCVEVRAGGEIIILDAGTGLRLLGRNLLREFGTRPLQVTILLTHTHWDHIQGLPYFAPIYQPNCRIRILGYEGTQKGLAAVVSGQMESPYFPIGLDKLPSSVTIEEQSELEFRLGPVVVSARCANHPGICMGYRLETPSGSVAYFPDNETGHSHWNEPPHPGCAVMLRQSGHTPRACLLGFLHDTDALILDAQYTAEEYAVHRGWGHGCLDDVVDIALEARARRLFLFHHDPDHDDAQIERMEDHARARVAAAGGQTEVGAAREGSCYSLGGRGV
jgi:phosphoribosyl 1,2-cyclic phosphodiesterase